MTGTLPPSPAPVFTGAFTEAHARRLLWRAGFGPRPGESARLARLGLDGAVASLTRPLGAVKLIGPTPQAAPGKPLDPINVWGDDHCWWLDRMVRSTHPLQEKMTLIWHSWFATSIDSSTAKQMLQQNEMMRGHWLGNFRDLFLDVTTDPAMLLWLSGSTNTKTAPNENYAREMMELFSLGADRGYTQDDVTNQARALTGWTNAYSPTGGYIDFHFDPTLHDDGVKTIFGQSGNFNWEDSVRLCVEHPLHPSFMVSKLWSYFIPTAPPAETLKQLEHAYLSSGCETQPLVEAILRHPLLYEGPRQVTPPIVFTAGMLRALGQGITTDAWAYIGEQCGQRLFQPPNVAGWDYTNWFDTARWLGRFVAIDQVLSHATIANDARYSAVETPTQAVAKVLAFWDGPPLSSATTTDLLTYCRKVERSIKADWEHAAFRLLRQNALRAMVPVSPDYQTN